METLTGLCKHRLLLNMFSSDFVPFRAVNTPKCIRRGRGLPPYKTKTLMQKLEEANYQDPAVYYKVDIGLPKLLHDKSAILQERIAHFKKLKNDPELEKNSRENKISLCLVDIMKEWSQESAPHHIKAAAEHYGIFQDLFGDAFFYPQVGLDVFFKDNESLVPVCRGNLVKPSQAISAPEFTYDAEPDSLWTMVVTNPDGNLLAENSECLHWLVGNIPGNDVSRGEVITEYIQPFPARGTGFQRLVFTLYKQTEKIDYSCLKKPSKEPSLMSRTFKTYEFYRPRQDVLTPAGLAFCQVDWDISVSRFFHTELEMEEPVYEYDFDPPYHPKQKMYPLKQAFNLYMDRYRDPKQIAKEYLLRKLKNRHPFESPKLPLRFPNAVTLRNDLNEKIYGKMPSWLKREKLKQRLGHGRINDY